MTVSKWGNSLAIRLPAAVVKALELKEGDQIEIGVAGKHKFTVARDQKREEALATIERLSWSLPAGFKFDREEINER